MEVYGVAVAGGYGAAKTKTCLDSLYEMFNEHRKRFSCLLVIKGVTHICDKYADSRKYFIDVDKMLREIDDWEVKMSSPTERVLLYQELNERLIKLRNKLKKKKIVVVRRDYKLLNQLHCKPCRFLCPTEKFMDNQMAGMYMDDEVNYERDKLTRMKYYDAIPKNYVVLIDSIEHLSRWLESHYGLKNSKHYEL